MTARTPIEEIQDAVSEYLAEQPEEAGHELEQELMNLWYDLDTSRENAINGIWSMDCESKVRRIVRLTRLSTNPSDYGDVPMSLIVNGWYEALNEAAGFPTPLTDEQRAEVADLYEKHIGRYRR